MMVMSKTMRDMAAKNRAYEKRKEEIKEQQRIVMRLKEMDSGKIAQAYSTFVLAHGRAPQEPKKRAVAPEKTVMRYMESDLAAWCRACRSASSVLDNLRAKQRLHREESKLQYDIMRARRVLHEARSKKRKQPGKASAPAIVIPRRKKKSKAE